MDILQKISDKSVRVGIMGLGYVGLPLAIRFADAGMQVVGFDVNKDVVEALAHGESHIIDVPSEDIGRVLERGLVDFTAEEGRLAQADAIIICVPTPLNKTGDPDVSYLLGAANILRRVLRKGQLVVLESTTYPGTTREVLLPAFEEGGFAVGEDFNLCFSPERIDPGNPVWHVGNTPRVIGGITESCRKAGGALYEEIIDQVIVVSSTEAAELTKLIENTFRAVNIALVNEMAMVADRLGVDIWEVLDAAASKPFGYMKFTPGPGIGGHCIPLDPHYLSWKMKTLQFRTRMVEIASEINSEMPLFVVDKVVWGLNRQRLAVNGSRVLVLGVAYKADIDDVRESPALDVIRLLEERGGDVVFYDPMVPVLKEEGGEREGLGELTDEELSKADVVVIITPHSSIDYADVVKKASLVVDSRNATKSREEHVIHLSNGQHRHIL